MADVFGEAKRQREGQKLKAFGLSAVLAEQQLCTCNTLFYTVLWNVTKTVNEHGERENEKWEQNLTSTLAHSVNSFLILCLFPTFHFFRSPCSRSLLPFPRFSNVPVLRRHYTTTAWDCQILRLWGNWTHDSDFLFQTDIQFFRI